jgi:hypothetical protein
VNGGASRSSPSWATCRAHGLLAPDDGADGLPEDHVAAEGLHGDLVRVDTRLPASASMMFCPRAFMAITLGLLTA